MRTTTDPATTTTTVPETPAGRALAADLLRHRPWCSFRTARDPCDCGLAEVLATIEDEARGLYHDRLLADRWRRMSALVDPGLIKAQPTEEGEP